LQCPDEQATGYNSGQTAGAANNHDEKGWREIVGAHADDDFGKWSDQSAGEAGKRRTRAKGDGEDSLGIDTKQLSDFTVLNDGAQIKPECRPAQNNYDSADDDNRTCIRKIR
jgi:hypothetical protein